MTSSKAVEQIELTGRVIDDWYDDDLDDGDIQVQGVLDMYGRDAIAGRHANFGYSGYFRGYVWLSGGRRKLVDWWTLFPNEEHHYPTQGDKGQTADVIRTRIGPLKGTFVKKVNGGYAFDPGAHLARQQAKVRGRQ
ncbi:MAG TPA: hypothetical protein VFC56_02460 [Stellaceae bacterium]|nr:hypothetical protein [Stellaceae bacterium]